MPNNKLKPDTLQPTEVWYYFDQLTQIPRPSKKEKKVIDWLMNFAKEHQLRVHKDKAGNIIISKNATPGMENKKGVVLQAHLDMVPQKNANKQFNFETDPIETYVEDGFVKANGTTLGADNGIGVACMMAILASEDIKHGPLEALFTVDEETGMTGAFALQPNLLKGDILLNLDTEEEGELCVGCAGGVNTTLSVPVQFADPNDNQEAYHLFIHGLKGGHSGMDINLGRANANKLMARLLRDLNQTCSIELNQINGGTLRNAIPREADAYITVKENEQSQIQNIINSFTDKIKKEYASHDPEIQITFEKKGEIEEVMTTQSFNKVINAIIAVPNGVLGVVPDMPLVVETSNNLAAVKTNKDTVKLMNLTRSSVDAIKEHVNEMFDSIAGLAEAACLHEGNYPGWRPDFNASILNTMTTTYRQLYNKEPRIKVVHAGLECGIIGSVYPEMELISLGPDIIHPHSPDEKVNIKSVERFWDYLIESLKNIPE